MLRAAFVLAVGCVRQVGLWTSVLVRILRGLHGFPPRAVGRRSHKVAKSTDTALAVLGCLTAPGLRAQEQPLAQPWDYAGAMKEVARKFRGRPGVVLHVG